MAATAQAEYAGGTVTPLRRAETGRGENVPNSPITATGGCLCGGVRYQIRGPLRDVVACHCSQCRRTTGNFVTATNVQNTDLSLSASGTLTWFRSSAGAERGFCSRCGGNLFWRHTTPGADHTAIMAGSIDPPTHLRLARHIFVASKSDYYDITDGLPQFAEWPQ